RHYSYSIVDDPVPSDELEAFLDANDLGQVPDPAAALEARFPQMPETQGAFYEIMDDGRRRRNVFGFSAETRRDNVLVSNGEEVVRYDGEDGQSDIGYPFMVFGLRDICDRPWMVARGRPQGRPMGEVRQQESGGRLTIELARESTTQRWVV